MTRDEDAKTLTRMSDGDLLNEFRSVYQQAQDLHPGARTCYECDLVMRALDAEIDSRGDRMRKRATGIGQKINEEVLGILPLSPETDFRSEAVGL